MDEFEVFKAKVLKELEGITSLDKRLDDFAESLSEHDKLLEEIRILLDMDARLQNASSRRVEYLLNHACKTIGVVKPSERLG